MITIQTAEKALKTVYLDVITEQLNTNINPFYAKVSQAETDIYGKDVVKLVSYGLNGGVGAGTEAGMLPKAGGNAYVTFRSELKNLYGTIEISDKAIRASQHSSGAFVDLLNAEMEGLLHASKENLQRMLIQNGTGIIATVGIRDADTPADCIKIDTGFNRLVEGMTIDIRRQTDMTLFNSFGGFRIQKLDREKKYLYLGKSISNFPEGYVITVQDSAGNELTGLDALFNHEAVPVLYGLSKSENIWMQSKNLENTLTDGRIDFDLMNRAVDHLEAKSGSQPDLIMCAYNTRRSYIKDAQTKALNIDYQVLDCGYKAISYCGVPIVADKYVEDNIMYVLNTKDFKMHRLCDWRWLEGEGGSVLKQKDNQAAYSATLVKYAELICDRPGAQVRIDMKC